MRLPHRTPAVFMAALPCAALLSACGDDLDSRNAAAGLDSQTDVEIISQASRTPAAEAEVQTFDDNEDASDEGDDGEEAPIVDAMPEDLMDSAQGFAPEPLDDTAGIAPEPIGAEPMQD